jgi:flagellar basal body-associated protein FliL
MSLIEKIQKQPRRKRAIILWVSTAVIMLIIVFVWMYSFSRSLEKFNQPKATAKSNQTEQNSMPSLFESLKRDFSAFKDIFKASVKELDTKVQDVNNSQNTTETK